MAERIVNRGFEKSIGFIVAALAVAGTEEAKQQRAEMVGAQQKVEAFIELLAGIVAALAAAKKAVTTETRMFKELLQQAVFVGRHVFHITVKPPTYSTIDKIDLDVRCDELAAWLQDGGDNGRAFAAQLKQQSARVVSAKAQVKATTAEVTSAKRDLGVARTMMFAKARQAEIFLQLYSPEGHAALRDSRRTAAEQKKAAAVRKVKIEQELVAEAQAKAECEALRAKAANADGEDKQVHPPPTPLARPA